jgi:serine/threonine-protein kinase
MDTQQQLLRLIQLRDDGLLTSEEFESKARLLMNRSKTGTTLGNTNVEQAVPANVVGAYELIEMVGEGGMGAVFRARHRMPAMAARQGGDVAIKLVHAHLLSEAEAIERLRREAETLASLDHPNIVKVCDLIEETGRTAIVMEWVPGRPLSQVIGTETGPIPWDRALSLVRPMLEAVAHAHSRGVVHRDLKPENILVTPDGKIKLLDFGIARLEKARGRTKAGTGMGTVDYMAPEQFLDARTIDLRADVYALGMTIYEMVAGRLPWERGQAEYEIMRRKDQGEVPPPTTYYPAIPPWVVDAVMGALVADPACRTPTVEALAAALSGESSVKITVNPEAKTSPEVSSTGGAADSQKRTPSDGTKKPPPRSSSPLATTPASPPIASKTPPPAQGSASALGAKPVPKSDAPSPPPPGAKPTPTSSGSPATLAAIKSPEGAPPKSTAVPAGLPSLKSPPAVATPPAAPSAAPTGAKTETRSTSSAPATQAGAVSSTPNTKVTPTPPSSAVASPTSKSTTRPAPSAPGTPAPAIATESVGVAPSNSPKPLGAKPATAPPAPPDSGGTPSLSPKPTPAQSVEPAPASFASGASDALGLLPAALASESEQPPPQSSAAEASAVTELTAAELREQMTSSGIEPGDLDLSAFTTATRWLPRPIRPDPTLFRDGAPQIIDLSGADGSSGWRGTDGSRGRDGADLGNGKRGRGGNGGNGTSGGDGQHASDARDGDFDLELTSIGVRIDGSLAYGPLSFNLTGGRGGDGGNGGSGGSGGSGSPSGSKGSDGRGGNGGNGGDGGRLRVRARHPHALAAIRHVDVSGGHGGSGGWGSPSGRSGRNGKDGSYMFHANDESGKHFGLIMISLTMANDESHLGGNYTRGSTFEIRGVSIGNGGDFTIPPPYTVALASGTPIVLSGTTAKYTDAALTVRYNRTVEAPLTAKGKVDPICDIGHFGVHIAAFSGICEDLCLNRTHADQVFSFSVNHRLVPAEVLLIEDVDRDEVQALADEWNNKTPEAQSEFFSSRILCHAAGPLLSNTRRRAELDGSIEGRLLTPKEMWARADANPLPTRTELACSAHFFVSLPDDTRLKMMDASIFLVSGEQVLPMDTKNRLLQTARYFGIQNQWFEKNYPRVLEPGDTKLGATLTNFPTIAWYSVFSVAAFVLGYVGAMKYDRFINTSGGFSDVEVLAFAGATMFGVVLPPFRWYTMRMSCHSCHSLNLRRLVKQEDEASLLGAADHVRCVDCGARGGVSDKAKAIMRGANLPIHSAQDHGETRAKWLAMGAVFAAFVIPPVIMFATEWVFLPSLTLLFGVFVMSLLSATLATMTRLFPVGAAVAAGLIAACIWVGVGASKERLAARPGCASWHGHGSALAAMRACAIPDPNFYVFQMPDWRSMVPATSASTPPAGSAQKGGAQASSSNADPDSCFTDCMQSRTSSNAEEPAVARVFCLQKCPGTTSTLGIPDAVPEAALPPVPEESPVPPSSADPALQEPSAATKSEEPTQPQKVERSKSAPTPTPSPTSAAPVASRSVAPSEKPAPAKAPEKASTVSVKSIFGKHSGDLKVCYETALKRTPQLEGKLVVELDIVGGAPKNVALASNTTGDVAFPYCVLGRIRGWDFKGVENGHVSMPLAFAPEKK